MIGLGKPKLYTKFEVTIFSHRVNIEGEPPTFGEHSWTRATPPFLLRVQCFYDDPWLTPGALQN